MNLLQHLRTDRGSQMLIRSWVTVETKGPEETSRFHLSPPTAKYTAPWVLGASQAVRVYPKDRSITAPAAKVSLHHEVMIKAGDQMWITAPEVPGDVNHSIPVGDLLKQVAASSQAWDGYRQMSWPMGRYTTPASPLGPVLAAGRDTGYSQQPLSMSQWLRRNKDRRVIGGQSRPYYHWAVPDAAGNIQACDEYGEPLRLSPWDAGVISMAPVDLFRDDFDKVDLDIAAMTLREQTDEELYFVREDPKYASVGCADPGEYDDGEGDLTAADDIYSVPISLLADLGPQVLEALVEGPDGEDARTVLSSAIDV